MSHQGLIAAAVHAAGLLVLGGVLLATALTDRPVGDFTREPVRAMLRTTCEGATCSAIGALSTLGVLIWAGCAAVCLTVAWIERRGARGGRVAPFFVWAGLLTLVLALDDGFAVHESLAYLISPSAEVVVFVVYGLAGAAVVLAFRAFVARTGFWLLAEAGALLAASIVLDRFLSLGLIAEDGAKWLAILAWTTYFVLTGLAVVDRGRRTSAPATA